jgi:formate hydrogenlyase subunit 4
VEGGLVTVAALARLGAALLLAPLLLGVIARTKAFFAGRTGAPLLQRYFDLAKLLRKGAVYSETTTWVFRAGPVVSLAAVLGALALLPMAGGPALFGFAGDFVLLAYLLGLARFATVLAALDTGSAFEGMGASREVQFSALAEPALLLALVALARNAHELSLGSILGAVSGETWRHDAAALTLVTAALFVVFLAENSRVPVDDPATHLELTMIHEVMVLDTSGPDLALVELGAALKMWLLGGLVVSIVVPVRSGNPWIDLGAFVAGLLALAALVGVVESTMARLRLLRVPALLVSAGVLAALGLALMAEW